MGIRIRAEKNKPDKKPKATAGPANRCLSPEPAMSLFHGAPVLNRPMMPAQVPGWPALPGTVSRPGKHPGAAGKQWGGRPSHASQLGGGPRSSEIQVGIWGCPAVGGSVARETGQAEGCQTIQVPSALHGWRGLRTSGGGRCHGNKPGASLHPKHGTGGLGRGMGSMLAGPTGGAAQSPPPRAQTHTNISETLQAAF